MDNNYIHPIIFSENVGCEEEIKIERTKTREQYFKSFIKKAPHHIKDDGVPLVQFEIRGAECLPLVAYPTRSDVDPVPWAMSNRQAILDQLKKYGAILFRGFNIKDMKMFNDFVCAVTPELVEYFEASTPRERISGSIYTSTKYHACEKILLHSEMSYAHDWPMKQWFYCDTPSTTGGETPIADNRNVLKFLPSHIREKFKIKNVLYTRTCSDLLGLSWQEIFKTDDPAQVEQYCRKVGIEWQWIDHNTLKTWQKRPATAIHPGTGDEVWFNQAHAYHYSSISEEVRTELLKVVTMDNLPRNAFYGDGSPLMDADLAAVYAAYDKAEVVFSWQKHDLLLLDNMLVSHGRNSFVGDRLIAVAMAEAYSNFI